MGFYVKLGEQTYAQPVACYRKRLRFNIAAIFCRAWRVYRLLRCVFVVR